MNVIVTLNAGLGSDLGPDVDLTADTGVVSPSTATLSELLAGATVVADNGATQITVTSTVVFTNSINLSITA
jgi:hypothetical protein